jgi:hypothetical protein
MDLLRVVQQALMQPCADGASAGLVHGQYLQVLACWYPPVRTPFPEQRLNLVFLQYKVCLLLNLPGSSACRARVMLPFDFSTCMPAVKGGSKLNVMATAGF